MNCPDCEKIKETTYCGCCGGSKKISFHRYVQYQLGWVLWLNDSGQSDATSDVMEQRCLDIIENCYIKYNKKGIPKLESYKGEYTDDPSAIMYHYTKQFN